MKTLKACLIALFLIPLAAYADVYQLQSFTDPDLGPELSHGDSARFEAGYVGVGETFRDQYGFSLAQASKVSLSIDVDEKFYNVPGYGSIQIAGAAFDMAKLDLVGLDMTGSEGIVVDSWSINTSSLQAVINLPAGLYDLNLFGHVIGTAAAYAGRISVTAVPLPAAMWLFGSALMALMVVGRRRKLHSV